MGYELLLIGDSVDIDNIVNTNKDLTVKQNNICITKFINKEDYELAMKKINNEGKCRAIPLKKVLNSSNYPIQAEKCELEETTVSNFYKWQYEGNEQFGIFSEGSFKLQEIIKNTLKEQFIKECASRFTSSSTGVFLAEYCKNTVKIYVGNFEKLFLKFDFDYVIGGIKFSFDDKFAAIITKGSTYVIDMVTGKVLSEIEGFYLVFIPGTENIINIRNYKIYNLRNGKEVPSKNEFKNIKKIASTKEQMLIFSEDKVQRITYISKNYTKTKTQANISDIDFIFSKNKGYAFVTKQLQNKLIYTVESYSPESLTITEIHTGIKNIKVSDDSFVFQNTNKELEFYIRDKYSYKKIKTIEKEEEVVWAVHGQNLCLFDSDTDNIEFYYEGEVRSAYMHKNCTNIQWSDSGLYVCAISNDSGLIQLFTCDGKLLVKQVFSGLNSFFWRPFVKLDNEHKVYLKDYDIKDYMPEDDNEIDTNTNVDELLDNWKSYLTSKMKVLQDFAKI